MAAVSHIGPHTRGESGENRPDQAGGLLLDEQTAVETEAKLPMEDAEQLGLARLRARTKRINYGLSPAEIEAKIEAEYQRIRQASRGLTAEDIYRQREPPVFTDNEAE